MHLCCSDECRRVVDLSPTYACTVDGGLKVAELAQEIGTVRKGCSGGIQVSLVMLKVAESFRVGDVVRAVVISLGDERSYYCSTAKNELGVVMARSETSGELMVPFSWKEFMDQGTGVRESRKVAKPV